MTAHAHAHAFDPQTGEVIDLPASTVPRAALDKAHAEIERLTDELKAVTAQRDVQMGSAGGLKMRVNDLTDELEGYLDGWKCPSKCDHCGNACGHQEKPVADRDTVLEILRWMKRRAGRDGSTKRPVMRIGMSSSAAKWVKAMFAHELSPHDICVAWLGLLTSKWNLDHPATLHPKFLCTTKGAWDDSTFDRHFEAGQRVLERERQERARNAA